LHEEIELIQREILLMRVTNYRLVRESPSDISNAVNQLIAEGWQPIGAPTVINTGHPNYIPALTVYQAMIKPE
jgi:hypothetical protein